MLEGKGGRIMTILQEREQRGIEKGIEKGMLLGELKREKELAKDMLIDGEPIDKIIRYTRLSNEEIEKIRKEIQS